MSSIAISLITFACVFGGVLVGISLRAALPHQHLSAESKDTVKVGMALVGTMAALVLGLLVASAKSSYDTQSTELTGMSSDAVLLDRVLSHYGPETMEARNELRGAVSNFIEESWSKDRPGSSAEPPAIGAEVLYDKVEELSPKDDTQRSIKAEALSLVLALGHTRWLIYEQRLGSVSLPLLVILIFWLTITFISFGLFAPTNATVVVSLFASALSVSGAVFLILAMYTPYSGLIQISSAPLRVALSQLGR